MFLATALVCAYCITFKACIPESIGIGSMFPISAFRPDHSNGTKYHRPGIRCLSAFYNFKPTVQPSSSEFLSPSQFRIEVHTRKCQIIIKVICCTNMPDPVIFTRISAHNILELHITGSQVQRIAKITGNLTAVISVSDCFSCNNIIGIESVSSEALPI